MAKKKPFVLGSKVTSPQGFFVIMKPPTKDDPPVNGVLCLNNEGEPETWASLGRSDSVAFFSDKKTAQDWLAAAPERVHFENADFWDGAAVVPAAKFFAPSWGLKWDQDDKPVLKSCPVEWKDRATSAKAIIKTALTDYKAEMKDHKAALEETQRDVAIFRDNIKEANRNISALTKLLAKAKR